MHYDDGCLGFFCKDHVFGCGGAHNQTSAVTWLRPPLRKDMNPKIEWDIHVEIKEESPGVWRPYVLSIKDKFPSPEVEQQQQQQQHHAATVPVTAGSEDADDNPPLNAALSEEPRDTPLTLSELSEIVDNAPWNSQARKQSVADMASKALELAKERFHKKNQKEQCEESKIRDKLWVEQMSDVGKVLATKMHLTPAESSESFVAIIQNMEEVTRLQDELDHYYRQILIERNKLMTAYKATMKEKNRIPWHNSIAQHRVYRQACNEYPSIYTQGICDHEAEMRMFDSAMHTDENIHFLQLQTVLDIPYERVPDPSKTCCTEPKQITVRRNAETYHGYTRLCLRCMNYVNPDTGKTESCSSRVWTMLHLALNETQIENQCNRVRMPPSDAALTSSGQSQYDRSLYTTEELRTHSLYK